MPVTDEAMATLRAYLTGNLDEYHTRWDQLGPTAAAAGYGALVTAAFVTAVERRFTEATPVAEVIKLVGETRIRFDETGDRMDPHIGERLIRAVHHDDDTLEDIDGRQQGSAQFLLLLAMVLDEGLEGPALDGFLAEARKMADVWMG